MLSIANVKKMLCIGVMLVSALPVYAQDVSDTQNEQSQWQEKWLENLTFDDVYACIGYISFLRVHYQPEKAEALSIMIAILMGESDTIYASACNKFNLSCAVDGYSQRRVVHDLFSVAFYRLIYEIAFTRVIFLGPNSEEVLVFKNILTPREFAKAHARIQISDDLVDVSLFPVSVREKALAYAKQLTFDESIMWLMGSSVQKKRTDPVGGALSTIMAVENLNQTMRAVIERQEQPGRRALLRFLWTDQEMVNLRINAGLIGS